MFSSFMQKLMRYRWMRVLCSALEAYDQDGCIYMAAALSFYGMLSLIPLTFVGLWALTAVIGSSHEALVRLEAILRQNLVPSAADDLVRRIQEIAAAGVFSILGTWWSVLAFAWSGVSFYETLHSTLSTAWGGVPVRPFLQRKLLTLTAFLVASLFLLLTLFLTAAVTAIDQIYQSFFGVPLHYLWAGLGRALPFAFSIALFFLLYKFMPNIYVPWRLALAVAAPVGILWEVGKMLFTAYIASRSTYSSFYGPMAGFVLLMIWIYYSSSIVLFGTEIGAAWQRETRKDKDASASGKEAASRYDLIKEEPAPDSSAGEIVVEIHDADPFHSRPLPVRAHVTASDGRHPGPTPKTVYADGRFFAEGKFTVRVPPGETHILLSSGPDYIPLALAAEAKAGKKLHFKAILHRWFSPAERGWYCGDNHVHAKHDGEAVMETGLAQAALQARASGLNYITEAGHPDETYRNSAGLNSERFLFANAPELHAGAFAGHLNTPGLSEPLTEGAYRDLTRRPLPVQAIARRVRDAGGAVIYTHPLEPPYQLHWMGAAELFSDAVLRSCADALDTNSPATELLRFAVLNLGNRIACSNSTDATLERPHTLTPGDGRVYCHAKEFSYRSVAQAIREGRTFATNGGPLCLFLTVGSHEPGDIVVPGKGKADAARLEIHSLYPLQSVRLYRNGNVHQEFDVREKRGETVLSLPLNEAEKCWYTARSEDVKGNWAVTSPIYFEPPQEARPEFACALLLEISNATRFTELRKEFFAHLIATVSPDDPLAEIHLLRDGQTHHRFLPGMNNHRAAEKIPVTELGGDYAGGWLWHPGPESPYHFQADRPVAKSGWYAVRITTRSGRTRTSDAVRFDRENPNSHELSIAQMEGADTRLSLWGYGEEMPLDEIKQPFEGDHWWYPFRTYWKLEAVFGSKIHEAGGGENTQAEKRFRKS
ncbi:MAG: YihY/virulence factor BrkB family protein [Armatimonadetes bacterium]|nr:YihY/virulence factor BrkB family protein [Armatimonadota bacterium]